MWIVGIRMLDWGESYAEIFIMCSHYFILDDTFPSQEHVYAS